MKQILLKRDRRQEDGNVKLWWWSSNGKLMVSVLDLPQGVIMRISTPDDYRQVGFPAAYGENVTQHISEYRQIAVNNLEDMGHDVRLVG